MSKSTRTAYFAAAAAAVLLAACTTVGPDFTAPAAPTAGSYAMAGDKAPSGVAMSPDARSAGAWWAAFGSPTLDMTIRQALAESPTVAEAAATLERARSDAAVASARRGLDIEANGSAVREKINTQAFGFTGFPSPTINLFTIGAEVTYDLDLFGGQRRTIERAQAKLEAEQGRADAAYLTLSGNVAMQAMRIAGLQAQIDTVNAVVASDRRQIEMIRNAERAGGAAPSQATVGEAQLNEDLALLPPVERDLAAARHQLALLVGKTPNEWTAPDFRLASFTRPASIPVSLPADLVRNRPDIAAAQAELHAATAQIGVITAATLPDVKLGASLTQAAIHPEDIFSTNSTGWSLGPSIKIPLNAQLGKAGKAGAVADANASLARYKATVLRAFVQVSDALTNLAHDQAQLDALVRAEATTRANVDDLQKAYDLGGGNLISVVDAQRRLAQTQRQTAQVQGRILEDLVQLHTATGANWRG